MQRRPRYYYNTNAMYNTNTMYGTTPMYNQNQPTNPYTAQATGLTEETKGTCAKNITKDMPMTQPMTGCNTTYTENQPIYSCTKNVVDQYHITKQPYICNYHTEVVHHCITENEYIPTYSKSDVYVNNQTPFGRR